MNRFLIDVNLPSRFSIWAGEEYEHVANINDELKDSEIWNYAKKHNLTIVTKDTDFSDMIMLNNPPVWKYENERVSSVNIKDLA